MPIFVSYARQDRAAVEVLARDLERTRESVWMDNELTGGQAWWDTILGQIRSCDLYVFALSPEALRSRACRLELQYAQAVRRPLLPVQIADLAITTAPQVIADTQIVDYRQRTPEAGFALAVAVGHRPRPPALPDPLPAEPAPPMSYMHEFYEQVDATMLSYQQQNHLLVDLRGYLSDDDDRDTALQLIRSLRGRRDVSMSVAQEIDRLLADQPSTPPPPSASQRQPTPPPYQPPPAPQRTAPQSQPTPGYRPPPQSQPTPPVQPSPAAFYQPPPQPYRPPAPRYQPVPGASAQPGSYRQPQPGPHPQGVIILVLAILGLFCGVTAIVALVLANRAMKEIDANPGRYTNRSMVSAARVVAWVILGLWVLYMGWYFLYTL